MTGAPMPDGADAVVMVERTRVDGDDHVVVEVGEVGRARAVGGRRRRRRRSRLRTRARCSRPRTSGVLASLDVHEVVCHPRPRVGVISTGDELVERGALAPGRIRDSNRPMLLALVEELGCEAVDGGIVGDDEHAITEAVERVAGSCDALLTSGAVSVGDYDFVKLVLERVAKRARRTRCGRRSRSSRPSRSRSRCSGPVPAFGLPGQPGLVARELRALRPAGAAQARRPRRRRRRIRAGDGALGDAAPARRQAAPRPGPGLARRTAATCASGPAPRRATCSRGWRAPTASPCSTTARASTPAPRSGCSCSDGSAGRDRPSRRRRWDKFGLLSITTQRGTTCTQRGRRAGEMQCREAATVWQVRRHAGLA